MLQADILVHKTMIIGDKQVGKTSIMDLLSTDSWTKEFPPDSQDPTFRNGYRPIQKGTITHKLGLWEMGTHAINENEKVFFKYFEFLVMVFDLTRFDTLGYLSWAIDYIKDLRSPNRLNALLIGNKADLGKNKRFLEFEKHIADFQQEFSQTFGFPCSYFEFSTIDEKPSEKLIETITKIL